MDFADDSYYQPGMHLGIPSFAPIKATNLWTRDAEIRKQFSGASTHDPDIFTLPRDHDIAQQSMLSPCEDIQFLFNKFKRDVAVVIGIPEDMISTESRGQETAKKTTSSGKMFTCNMLQMCSHLQNLLSDVYSTIYKKENAEFTLMPMPRIEIDSVADIKALFDMGAITPDMTTTLSQILVGEDIHHGKTVQKLKQLKASQTSKTDILAQKQKTDITQPEKDKTSKAKKEESPDKDKDTKKKKEETTEKAPSKEKK